MSDNELTRHKATTLQPYFPYGQCLSLCKQPSRTVTWSLEADHDQLIWLRPRSPPSSKPCSDQAKTLFFSQYRLSYINRKLLTRLLRINRPNVNSIVKVYSCNIELLPSQCKQQKRPKTPLHLCLTISALSIYPIHPFSKAVSFLSSRSLAAEIRYSTLLLLRWLVYCFCLMRTLVFPTGCQSSRDCLISMYS